jgi:uncharacterized MAPEG superfamily protein
MSSELGYLVAAIVLGLAQLGSSAFLVNQAYGPWGAGPRDEPPRGKPSVLAGRLDRAFRNFTETFPFAAAAILAAEVLGRHNGLTGWGAALYFWGRLVYVPLYAAGVPFVRSLVWLVATAGIVVVLVGLRGA